uniref:Uncharacterized protein n=1 Tax=Setaria digitata TaxID=48799 RepID=A0A915Q4Z4_9BILA
MQDVGQINKRERSVKALIEWRSRSWYGMTEISYVVSIHELNGRVGGASKDLTVLRIHIADMPEANISEYFSKAVSFIHRARLSKKSVLVHCIAGVSRSVCVVAAYLIVACDMNYAAALAYIVSKRPCANPNFGFRMQLSEYAEKKAASEGIIMRSEFDSEAFDEMKANDKKVLLLDCSVPVVSDKTVVCAKTKSSSPNTSTKKGCVDCAGYQYNTLDKSAIFCDSDISFIDQ